MSTSSYYFGEFDIKPEDLVQMQNLVTWADIAFGPGKIDIDMEAPEPILRIDCEMKNWAIEDFLLEKALPYLKGDGCLRIEFGGNEPALELHLRDGKLWLQFFKIVPDGPAKIYKGDGHVGKQTKVIVNTK